MKKYYKAEAYAKKYARQAGMTLIELTVVLLILIGLAGLLIPYVSGFVSKTHDSTGSANLAQVSNALTRYETEQGSYPNNMDSLLLTTGALIDYTMAAPATAYGMTVADLSAGTNDVLCWSLRKAGITATIAMDDGTKANFNPTFNNADDTTPTLTLMTGGIGSMAPTCTGKVVEVSATEVEKVLGKVDASKRYVAFGIGQANDAVGKTMQDAPVHFAKSGAMNASNKYNRFIALFAVDGDAGSCSDGVSADATACTTAGGTWTAATTSWSTAKPAKLAGTAMAMMELTGLGTELGSYYTTANN